MTSHGVGTIAGLIGYALQGIFPKNLSLFWTSLLLIGTLFFVFILPVFIENKAHEASLALLMMQSLETLEDH